jgi:hypothetical protein
MLLYASGAEALERISSFSQRSYVALCDYNIQF